MTYTCLLIPMPPSANHIWRSTGKGVYRSAQYIEWLTEAGYALKQQQVPSIAGHYKLKLSFGPRRGDLGNREKAVSDLLEAHGIIENDGLADEIHLYWDANVVGCQIEIEAVETVRTKVSAAGMTS